MLSRHLYKQSSFDFTRILFLEYNLVLAFLVQSSTNLHIYKAEHNNRQPLTIQSPRDATHIDVPRAPCPGMARAAPCILYSATRTPHAWLAATVSRSTATNLRRFLRTSNPRQVDSPCSLLSNYSSISVWTKISLDNRCHVLCIWARHLYNGNVIFYRSSLLISTIDTWQVVGA